MSQPTLDDNADEPIERIHRNLENRHRGAHLRRAGPVRRQVGLVGDARPKKDPALMEPGGYFQDTASTSS